MVRAPPAISFVLHVSISDENTILRDRNALLVEQSGNIFFSAVG